MNRRQVLALTTVGVSTSVAGCLSTARSVLGVGDTDGFPDPEDDPFPIEDPVVDRGEDDAVVMTVPQAEIERISQDRDVAFEDGSAGCSMAYAEVVHPDGGGEPFNEDAPIFQHFEEELGDWQAVSLGTGRYTETDSGMQIGVSRRVDEDGEVVSEADIPYDEFVAVTPSTVHLVTEDDERLCSLPVYVVEKLLNGGASGSS